MSAPSISTSLTSECLSAMQSPYSTMATACGEPNGPSITALATNTQSLLTSACSTACSSAITAFTTAANTTCAEQKVFQGDSSTTAHALISQFALVTAVGCIKDTDGSYCVVGQLSTLTGAGLSPNSANLLTNLATYAGQNTSFACTTCAKNEIAAAKALTTLDAAWSSQVLSVVQGQSLICATQTTTAGKNSATDLYVGSIFSLGLGVALAALFSF